MKQRPINFSSSEVRAILNGSKTQMRPPWREQPQPGAPIGRTPDTKTPYGKTGDRIWVREKHSFEPWNPNNAALSDGWPRIYYLADGTFKAIDQVPIGRQFYRRPSIQMPRWASRITLEITAVRVERLLDISEADARAEGIAPFNDGHGWHSEEGRHYAGTAADAYLSLWATINGEASARANPWVWVIEFEKVST